MDETDTEGNKTNAYRFDASWLFQYHWRCQLPFSINGKVSSVFLVGTQAKPRSSTYTDRQDNLSSLQ